MPELPEVQTIISDLQQLTGDSITGFWTDWKNALKHSDGKVFSCASFQKSIVGKKILSVKRHGKFIFINLSEKTTLLIHLRMTGQLLVRKTPPIVSDKYASHVHHVFFLKKHGELAFSDVRKFATITLFHEGEQPRSIAHLGIDALDGALTVSELAKIVATKKDIKSLLMDQTRIAGIGNIYASEILHNAAIHPAKKASSLEKEEIETLHKEIRRVLTKAIQLRGTSVSDYRDSAGKKGGFQKVLKVYKRHGQRCKRCDTIIQKTIIGQRSTFHCPRCQTL